LCHSNLKREIKKKWVYKIRQHLENHGQAPSCISNKEIISFYWGPYLMIILQPFSLVKPGHQALLHQLDFFSYFLEALHCIAATGSFIVRCGITGSMFMIPVATGLSLLVNSVLGRSVYMV
jgi:hypothetical protein